MNKAPKEILRYCEACEKTTAFFYVRTLFAGMGETVYECTECGLIAKIDPRYIALTGGRGASVASGDARKQG